MKKTVTFGEIMLRLKTPEHLRIVQTDGLSLIHISFNKESVYIFFTENNPASLIEIRVSGIDNVQPFLPIVIILHVSCFLVLIFDFNERDVYKRQNIQRSVIIIA